MHPPRSCTLLRWRLQPRGWSGLTVRAWTDSWHCKLCPLWSGVASLLHSAITYTSRWHRQYSLSQKRQHVTHEQSPVYVSTGEQAHRGRRNKCPASELRRNTARRTMALGRPRNGMLIVVRFVLCQGTKNRARLPTVLKMQDLPTLHEGSSLHWSLALPAPIVIDTQPCESSADLCRDAGYCRRPLLLCHADGCEAERPHCSLRVRRLRARRPGLTPSTPCSCRAGRKPMARRRRTAGCRSGPRRARTPRCPPARPRSAPWRSEHKGYGQLCHSCGQSSPDIAPRRTC